MDKKWITDEAGNLANANTDIKNLYCPHCQSRKVAYQYESSYLGNTILAYECIDCKEGFYVDSHKVLTTLRVTVCEVNRSQSEEIAISARIPSDRELYD